MRERDASGGVERKRAKTCVVCLSGGTWAGVIALYIKRHKHQHSNTWSGAKTENKARLQTSPASMSQPMSQVILARIRPALLAFLSPRVFMFPCLIFLSHVIPVFLYLTNRLIYCKRRQVISTQTWPQLSSTGSGLRLHENTSSVCCIVLFICVSHIFAGTHFWGPVRSTRTF